MANTTVVMLGTGTSVTQAAMREFVQAGVLVGFCESWLRGLSMSEPLSATTASMALVTVGLFG